MIPTFKSDDLEHFLTKRGGDHTRVADNGDLKTAAVHNRDLNATDEDNGDFKTTDESSSDLKIADEDNRDVKTTGGIRRQSLVLRHDWVSRTS